MDLSNFNPFKKKENEFKLDEMPLPSLNDMSTNNSFSSFGNSQSNNDDFGKNSDFTSNYEPEITPSFAKSLPQPAPMLNEREEMSVSSHSQQLNSAQMETVLAKVTLIDARLSSMESKLELLTKLILEEVSDETKRKFKVKSMMDSMR